MTGKPVRGNQELYLPAGSTGRAPFALEVTPESAGWTYSSLRTLVVPPGGEVTFDTGQDEMLVLPLAGSCHLACDGQELEIDGRRSVFSRVTDFAYVPRDATVTVRSGGGGRFALPAARAGRRLPVRYGPAEKVPVEIRGAGTASRQVNNFCSPDGFATDKLVSVEVLTPGGNWSSYPPHKHDEYRAGETVLEAVLEEIYYFEVTGSPYGSGAGGSGLGYQRVYDNRPQRRVDVLAEVRTGDVVLIPHGYHGPSMAAPGYDLYFLNVLAGPAEERSMAFCDDPAHAWVRSSWAGSDPGAHTDDRLPMTSVEERTERP